MVSIIVNEDLNIILEFWKNLLSNKEVYAKFWLFIANSQVWSSAISIVWNFTLLIHYIDIFSSIQWSRKQFPCSFLFVLEKSDVYKKQMVQLFVIKRFNVRRSKSYRQDLHCYVLTLEKKILFALDPVFLSPHPSFSHHENKVTSLFLIAIDN